MTRVLIYVLLGLTLIVLPAVYVLVVNKQSFPSTTEPAQNAQRATSTGQNSRQLPDHGDFHKRFQPTPPSN